MKIIPSIDLMGGKVVRLSQGDPSRLTVYGDDAPSIAAKWERNGADSLHIVDLDATLSRGNNLEVIGKIRKRVGIPIQVGGGVRSQDYAQSLRNIGVNRLVIGTIAVTKKELFREILSHIGNESIIVALDYLGKEVVTHGWTKGTGLKLIHTLKDTWGMGVNAFLLTCVERDGMLTGPDIDALKEAKKVSGVEIQASGGVSSINDIEQLKKASVDAVILGKALYEQRIRLDDAIAITRGVMKVK